MLAAANTPISHNAPISAPAVAPLAFIVGMSRSGTTWMLQSLNRHPEVAAFGETGFWGKHFVNNRAERYGPREVHQVLSKMPGVKGQRLEPKDAATLGRVLSGSALRRLFEPLRRNLTEGEVSLTPDDLFSKMCGVVADYTGKRLVVEKTPHHVHYAERIARAYPETRFIVMMREPYGFMLSYKHQGDRKEDEVKDSFKRLYHPIGCAMVYRGYARSIVRLQSRLPKQTCVIALEDVTRDPSGVLRRIAAFLDLSPMGEESLPAINSSFPQGPAVVLEREDVFWMNSLAGSAIRALGYKMDPAANFADGIGALPSLPLWGWRAMAHLMAYQNARVMGYLRQWLA